MKTTLELLKQSLYLSKGTSVGRLDNELTIFITVQQVSKFKKKFQVAFWQPSKKKWSPNAKMQSPDSTRTEAQIRAPFN